MENPAVRKIYNWVSLVALFTVSFQFPLKSQELITSSPSGVVRSVSGIDPVLFTFNCLQGHPGDTICIPVTVENFTDIVILQFELIWNSDVLDYIEIQNPGTPSINVNSDFNLSGPNALKFIPLGFPINGESLPNGTVLFEICFRIIGTPGSVSCLGISPFFPYEVADINGVVPSESDSCCTIVDDAVNLVGFVTSCGPAMAGGNGSIDITVYGGTAPYTVTWVDGLGTPGGPVPIALEGGNTILNVPSENYTITITDALGSMVSYTAEVDLLGLSVVTRLKQPTCYSFNNGIIWIKPRDGSAPYNFIWQSLTNPNIAGSGFIRNPGDSSIVTSLPDGIYQIIVEDNNGCEVIVQDTLIDNPFVFTINDFQNATCNGSADGFIDLTITGATPDVSGNYTILVKPGVQFNSNMITVGLLDPGDYCITVSDEVSQCDTVFCFTIGYTDTITATVTTMDPACFGDASGRVQLRGRTNGVPGPFYDYAIYRNGVLVISQAMVFGNYSYNLLPAGNYMAIVTEGSCVSDSIPFSIVEPLPVSVSLSGFTPDNCIFTNTGDVWFNVMNGTPPYMLDVGAGFQDGDTIFNIGSGNYILTVTDDNGCTATLPFTMEEGDYNEEADISFVFDGTPCEGGTLIVLYQGGPVPPNVGIMWSNGQSGDTIIIQETDTLGVDLLFGGPIFCILDDTVHIECTVKLDLDITVQQPLCGDGALGGPYFGTVIADTSNAVPPVTWYWSFPDTTTSGIYSGLSPGKYYVTVTDAMDSMAIDSFEIIAPPSLQLTFTNLDSTSCPETCDGAVRVMGTNGDPGLDYFLYWDPVNPMGDTGIVFSIQNLCAGYNVFTVSQDGNCFFLDSIEILAPDSMDVNLVQAVDASCYGLADGSIEVNATGGTPGYSYAWVNGPPASIISGIAAGYHQVMVTDSKNCTTLDSFLISQPDTLIADIDSSATFHLSCGSSDDGVITVEVSGGNPGGYNFAWNPNVSSSYQAVNLMAGNYIITVSDSKGCQDTTSFTLTSPPPVMATWPVVEPPACFGDETLFQLTTVTGGSGTYNFSINSGELFEIGDPVFLPAGIFIISVVDDRGCSDDTTYTIMQPNPILISIGPDDPVIDLGDSLFITGTVVQSDNPIIQTLWNSNEPLSCAMCEGTWVFNSLPAIYTWTVTDVNGCTASASIMVNVDFDRDVFIPNVFTPNNDGRNDDFRIFTGPGVVAINSMQIYDRWGNLIHNEENLAPSPTGAGNWNGTRDSDPMNPGVYVYVVEIRFIDGAILSYRGDITLIR